MTKSHNGPVKKNILLGHVIHNMRKVCSKFVFPRNPQLNGAKIKSGHPEQDYWETIQYLRAKLSSIYKKPLQKY